MNVNERTIKLIKEFEGFAPYLYNDPAPGGGNATVGYGELVHLRPYHQQRGVCGACDRWPRQNERHLWISGAQGDAMLRAKVRPYADAVTRLTTAHINENQYGALVDLCYNIGQGGYMNSPVRRAVNSGGHVCEALMHHVYANGVKLPGLERRRKADCALYHAPVILTAEQEEEEMPYTKTVAPFWTLRKLNGRGTAQWWVDFPDYRGVTALELDVTLVSGRLQFFNGDGTIAGVITPGEPKIVRVYPRPDGSADFTGMPDAHVAILALAGVLRS